MPTMTLASQPFRECPGILFSHELFVQRVNFTMKEIVSGDFEFKCVTFKYLLFVWIYLFFFSLESWHYVVDGILLGDMFLIG